MNGHAMLPFTSFNAISGKDAEKQPRMGKIC